MAPRPVFVSFTDLSLTFPEIRLANVTTTSTKLGQDDAPDILGIPDGMLQQAQKRDTVWDISWDIWSINDPYDLDVHQKKWALIWPCPQLRSVLDMAIMISFNLRRAPETPQVHPINLLMYSYMYLYIYIYIYIHTQCNAMQCNTLNYITLWSPTELWKQKKTFNLDRRRLRPIFP